MIPPTPDFLRTIRERFEKLERQIEYAKRVLDQTGKVEDEAYYYGLLNARLILCGKKEPNEYIEPYTPDPEPKPKTLDEDLRALGFILYRDNDYRLVLGSDSGVVSVRVDTCDYTINISTSRQPLPLHVKEAWGLGDQAIEVMRKHRQGG